MKVFVKSTTKILVTSFFSVLILLSSMNAYKTNTIKAEEVKSSYVLTYPDGSTEEVETLQEAETKSKEWKLLKTGKTDENGKIVLEGWFIEGEIKIVEIKAPEGYEIIEKETICNLSDKEVTIKNKKIEEPKPEPKKEEPKPPVRIPKTGVEASVFDKFSNLLSPFKESEVPEEPVELQGDDNNKTADFIINKVDEDGKPLKDAEFEVYGKPTISEIKPATITFKKIRLYPTDITYGSDEPYEPKENDFYYDETSTIIIEAIDGSDFKQEIKLGNEEEKTLSLKPGKYKVTEPIPSNITMLDSSEVVYTSQDNPEFTTNVQYYLNNYEIEIDNEGNMRNFGNESWIRLFRNNEIPYEYYVDDKAGEYEVSPYKVEVENMKITITNYASVVKHYIIIHN